jgi:uncharacterized protein YcbK (DUF882 family)
MGDITKNFSKHEFECKCGCEMPDDVLENIQDLAEELQILRDHTGKSMTINSAYRCLIHNRNIGSNDSSQHPKGKAADITIKRMTPDEVVEEVLNILTSFSIVLAVGRYNTFTHLDIRGRAARWDNRS